MTATSIQMVGAILLIAVTPLTLHQLYLLARDLRKHWKHSRLIRITITNHGHTIADYTGNNPQAAAQLLRTTATQIHPPHRTHP